MDSWTDARFDEAAHRSFTAETSAALIRIGIRSQNHLAAQDPDRLYSLLCRLDRRNHDTRLRDMFAAVIWVARGNPAKPWWEFHGKPWPATTRLLNEPVASYRKHEPAMEA